MHLGGFLMEQINNDVKVIKLNSIELGGSFPNMVYDMMKSQEYDFTLEIKKIMAKKYK